MTGLGGLDNSKCKRILDLLEASYLRLGEIVIENYCNKKHLKNVGSIRYCEPPLHCQSPGVASCTAQHFSNASCCF